uniref:Aminotransferase class I/classII domain-containing protein n=1 Tax=Arundo donax TaxID=35708 RepID=A0A0A9GBM6_ARUDO
MKKDYEVRRDFILQLLKDFGFHISFKPQGSVFVFAELPMSWQLSDIDFVTKLINDAGVVAVPGRGFFHRSFDGESCHHRYVRFAFCKGDDTLKAAALKMRDLADGKGRAWLTGRHDDQTESTSH